MTPKSRKSPAYFREIVGNQTLEAATFGGIRLKGDHGKVKG